MSQRNILDDVIAYYGLLHESRTPDIDRAARERNVSPIELRMRVIELRAAARRMNEAHEEYERKIAADLILLKGVADANAAYSGSMRGPSRDDIIAVAKYAFK